MPRNKMGCSLVRVIQLTSLYCVPVFGAITDIFIVKTDGGPGSCDTNLLDAWFNDAVTLGNSAAAGVAATDEDSRTYLTSFFRYGQTDQPTMANTWITGVNNFLSGTTPDGGKPWLFCDSTWALEQQWTDVAYDTETNEKRKDGQTCQDYLDVTDPTTLAQRRPFYSMDLKDYFVSKPGDYCKANPANYGATQDITTPRTVTLCVANIQAAYSKASLGVIPAVTRSRISIDGLQVQPMTFYHELFHLVFGSAASPDSAVFLEPIMSTISTDQARSNPETYTMYALAYYLGQNNADWSFASSSSKKKRATKRWADDLGYMAAYQPPKRALPANAWWA